MPKRDSRRLHAMRATQKQIIAKDLAQTLHRMAHGGRGERKFGGHLGGLSMPQQPDKNQENRQIEFSEFDIPEIRHESFSFLFISLGEYRGLSEISKRKFAMKIAIIGTGNVGGALALGWTRAGTERSGSESRGSRAGNEG